MVSWEQGEEEKSLSDRKEGGEDYDENQEMELGASTRTELSPVGVFIHGPGSRLCRHQEVQSLPWQAIQVLGADEDGEGL